MFLARVILGSFAGTWKLTHTQASESRPMNPLAILQLAWQWGLTPHLMLGGLYAICRCGAMVAAAPFPQSSLANWRLRAAIAIVLGVAAAPTAATSSATVTDWWLLIPLLAGEVLIGVCFGLAVRLMWSGLQAGGAIVSRMVGIRAATSGGGDTVPISQLVAWTAVAALLALGGHRPAIGALLDSFHQLPPGASVSLASIQLLLLNLLQASLHLAVAVAAPAAICVLLAWAAQGVLKRVIPRTDAFAFGFAGQALALVAGVWISLGATSMLFAQQIEALFVAIAPNLQ